MFKTKLAPQDLFFYTLIISFTLLRALTSKVLPCRTDFDCNSYIHMAQTLAYDPAILPHHAMRVLPSSLAHLLMELGFSTAMAFRILSDFMYVLFGGLSYWVLRQHHVKPLIAFSFSLLCLAPHHAMRIPLQDVYQLCDIMTYPIALLIVHFTLNKQGTKVFALSLIGLLTKQTLFGLGGLALIYCLWTTRKLENLIYMVILGAGYLLLQQYYHAFSIVSHHLMPNNDFFSFDHILGIISQSKVFDLIIVLVPILIFYVKEISQFLLRHWYVAFYMAVVVGQPFIAFHLTGNNFQRLALQGLWLLYLIAGLSTVKKPWKSGLEIPLALYAVALYFTWSMSSRMIIMGAFALICLFYVVFLQNFQERANKIEQV